MTCFLIFADSLGHFNYWFYVYIFFALVSTAYTFTWDVKMDWSLGNLKQNDNWYLRSELIYPYKVLKEVLFLL